jgi:hypothetical protein
MSPSGPAGTARYGGPPIPCWPGRSRSSCCTSATPVTTRPLARFKAEARHAGALSHQNIARVYDYGEPGDGQPYLVMELVDGPSLADVLAGGPLSAGRTMDVVARVAAGLQAAHCQHHHQKGRGHGTGGGNSGRNGDGNSQ